MAKTERFPLETLVDTAEALGIRELPVALLRDLVDGYWCGRDALGLLQRHGLLKP